MDPNLQRHLDAEIHNLIDETVSYDVKSDEFAAAAKNLADFSKLRTLLPEPDPEPIPVPKTRWQKVKAELGPILGSETMQRFIAAFGGVAATGIVVGATIKRDHVLDKQAMAQANQRNSI